MERPLLKRQQPRLLVITSSPLREYKHALPFPSHLLRRPIKRRHSSVPIRAIDKHRARQRHEPPQDRHPFEAALGGDRAVRREDPPEEQDVELRLVVADEDGGAGGQVFLPGDDGECYAGGEAHEDREAAACCVLGYSAVAHGAEGDAGEDAIAGGEEEGEVGGEAAGEEGGEGLRGEGHGEAEEGDGCEDVGQEAIEGVGEEGVHGGRRRVRCAGEGVCF